MYNKDGKIYLGLSEEGKVELPLSMANRHGLIAGASGTGKTITMKVMAESFSDAEVLMELGGPRLGVGAGREGGARHGPEHPRHLSPESDGPL